MARRLLEPTTELALYDAEHVLVRVTASDGQVFELVLEDARWRELSRRRVSLRHAELVKEMRDG